VSAKPTATAPPIYTKTGDDGTTGLLFGGRVSKPTRSSRHAGRRTRRSPRWASAARSSKTQPQEIVLNLQRGLFAAAAEIAANPRSHDRLVPGISSVTAEMTAALAQAIDALVAEHPLRPAFVVPGANQRRPCWIWPDVPASRGATLIAARERGMAVSAPLLAYVNRASDLAYVLARRATGGGEPLSHE